MSEPPPIPIARPDTGEEEWRALREVLESGWLTQGPQVAAFEAAFAARHRVAHALATTSCTTALHVALAALGVGPGDEVIVPSNTYIASWLAVSAVGATVVPVEPEEATYAITPAAVGAAVTARTAAVMCVHLHGRVAHARELRLLCDRLGVALVEDAAQAHGATGAGSTGHVAAFSFYPSKNLGAQGDAGAVTTDDPALADRVRVLRNYGSRERYLNEERGINSRLDPIQAAMLRVKLGRVDEWNARRRALAARYAEALAGTDLVLPRDDGAAHVWHLYVVRDAHDRDGLRDALAARGIATQVHYPVPPHRSGAYAEAGLGPVPVADRLAAEVLSLPIGPQLPVDAVDRVAHAVLGIRHAVAR